jgi:hypothetical protein
MIVARVVLDHEPRGLTKVDTPPPDLAEGMRASPPPSSPI